MDGRLNTVIQRPGEAPLVAPTPTAPASRFVVRRLHAFVPEELFGDSAGAGALLARLRTRYPRVLKKTLAYLRTEGIAQTWTKIRTRTELDRREAAQAAFAAVGLIVNASDGPWPAGTPVLCWSWQGPVDADYHVVAPDQCLPVPMPAPEFALAPFLAWIASVLRGIDGGVKSMTLFGLDSRLSPLLAELVQLNPQGRDVEIGCVGRDAGRQGALTVRLSSARAIAPLVAIERSVLECRLPDPAHYLLDPYYPGPIEDPAPFSRKNVIEAVALLSRKLPAADVTLAPPLSPTTLMKLRPPRTVPARSLGVSCLGAGNYVRAVLLHHLRRHARVHVRGVMDIRPDVAALQGRALAADFCTTDAAAVVDDPQTSVILIASDHASHADYAIAGLSAGKTVHLEKPPAVSADQLERLLVCLRATPQPRLHLGYNRPFAPAIVELQSRLSRHGGPTRVICHVRGYRLSRAHWYRWPNQGTRIAGNIVHWIDLGYRLSGRQTPISIAVSLDANATDSDALTLAIAFEDGSKTTIYFSSDEDETYGMRERIEIRRQRFTAIIEDFLTLACDDAGVRGEWRYARDKGHAANIAALAALTRREPARDEIDHTIVDLSRTGAIQFAAEQALLAGGGKADVAPFLTRFGEAARTVPSIAARPR